MWKLVMDNDAKYTARPGVLIVTNFVMRSRARLRRGEGTPPYKITENFLLPVGAYRHKIPTLCIIKGLEPKMLPSW